ncbi:MAG: rhodanese-related sulfurtransferase [Nanoarchaeota archaeon]|mgnify:CR=1 FL=1
MKQRFKVLLYYKYIKLNEPESIAKEHKEFCERNALLGRIIIAEEGINGTCAGRFEDMRRYIDYVHSIEGLEDIIFKEHIVDEIPFKKLKVKCRKEVVNFGEVSFDLTKKGKYLSPNEFHKLCERSEYDNSIVIFDVRNEVESKVGRFRNAITPKINFFRELKDIIKEYKDLMDKKVLMYCTGGIRCEKASTFFIENGFKQVYQLEGGIYNYCKEFPNGFFEGSCFVFDNRMRVVYTNEGVSALIPEGKIISSCDFCGVKSSRIVNDERMNQRHLVVCCEGCDKKFDVSRVSICSNLFFNYNRILLCNT